MACMKYSAKSIGKLAVLISEYVIMHDRTGGAYKEVVAKYIPL